MKDFDVISANILRKNAVLYADNICKTKLNIFRYKKEAAS